MVSAEARSHRPIARAPLMYARYVYVWMMCCSCYYSNSTCMFVGRACGCMFTVCILASGPHPDSSEQPIACPPSRQGHSRFWCYSDWCGTYGLTLSAIWPLLPIRTVAAEHRHPLAGVVVKARVWKTTSLPDVVHCR